MGLNAGMSLMQVGSLSARLRPTRLIALMQSYGTDVGGFAGPLPSPELFTRWVQFGVTNSRFCIHSFKPTKEDPTGSTTNNLPWMVGGSGNEVNSQADTSVQHPEVLPIIRATIKRRYEMLPFL